MYLLSLLVLIKLLFLSLIPLMLLPMLIFASVVYVSDFDYVTAFVIVASAASTDVATDSDFSVVVTVSVLTDISNYNWYIFQIH